jgi:hypothetical protein
LFGIKAPAEPSFPWEIFAEPEQAARNTHKKTTIG